MEPLRGDAPRPLLHELGAQEMAKLLALDLPARLATIDRHGFPRITPLWFLWEDGCFYATSLSGKPHLGHLRRNPRAAFCVDTEQNLDGVRRPNAQVKGFGEVVLEPDEEGRWTRRISQKYLYGQGADADIERRSAMERVVMAMRPLQLVGVGGGRA